MAAAVPEAGTAFRDWIIQVKDESGSNTTATVSVKRDDFKSPFRISEVRTVPASVGEAK
jgi:hypothetical protein